MNNYVSYESSERCGIITLNRPEKRNALNSEVVDELLEAFSAAGQDEEVKVIILRAAGPVFCAGADLEYLQKLQNNSREENLEDSQQLKALFLRIYTLNKVVIAQVHGHAIAGGCGLATVCDFIFTVPEAKFGYTEVKIGFLPALVKVFLLRRIGEGHARRLLLTGDLIDAQTARDWGLVYQISDPGKLQEDTELFAQKLIKENSGDSMAMVKEMIAHVPGLELASALDYAAQMNARARETPDCRRGITAFLNKDKISW